MLKVTKSYKHSRKNSNIHGIMINYQKSETVTGGRRVLVKELVFKTATEQQWCFPLYLFHTLNPDSKILKR